MGVLVLNFSMYLLPIVKTPTTSVFPSYALQHHQFNLHYRYLILLVRAKDGRTYDTIGELFKGAAADPTAAVRVSAQQLH